MKKMIALAAVVMLTLASCKKDRNCECVDAEGVKDVTTIPKSTKSDAQKACDALNTIEALGGGKCTLK